MLTVWIIVGDFMHIGENGRHESVVQKHTFATDQEKVAFLKGFEAGADGEWQWADSEAEVDRVIADAQQQRAAFLKQ